MTTLTDDQMVAWLRDTKLVSLSGPACTPTLDQIADRLESLAKDSARLDFMEKWYKDEVGLDVEYIDDDEGEQFEVSMHWAAGAGTTLREALDQCIQRRAEHDATPEPTP